MPNQLAFIFPGQGSQSLGMLGDLAKTYPQIEQTFQRASNQLGYDLWQVTQTGPVEKLNQTEVTQPALLTAGYALWQISQELSDKIPTLLAGHSLGEYTALVCAKALDFETAVSLVAARGRFMQQAVPEGQGAMAAIVGLEDDQVIALCDQAAQGEIVAAANFNSVGQVVIGGNKAAVQRAIKLAEDAGAILVLTLPMSAPSHCLLMKPAALQLEEVFRNISISKPEIPVLNNVDVAIEQEPTAIKDALIRQLYNPVRFVEMIQTMHAKGFTQIVECGPGKVLTGLIKRISKALTCQSLSDTQSLQKWLQA